jgi:uncharacterized membrane protein YedE/YeeE
MQIDWTAFTPYSALAGGALIGLAVAVFVLGTGGVAGISGLLGGAVRGLWQRVQGHGVEREGGGNGQRERWAFLGGLLAAPLLWRLFGELPPSRVDIGPLALLAAGLLVGVGTRMSGGCTSGHGVCGVARLSWRSIVATGVFMVAGFATVALMRHVF